MMLKFGLHFTEPALSRAIRRTTVQNVKTDRSYRNPDVGK